jgi:hypothetical protein
MVDGTHMGIFLRQTVDNLAGFVFAAVVDGDNFPLLGYFGKNSLRLADHSFNVGFLVVTGEKNGKGRKLGHVYSLISNHKKFTTRGGGPEIKPGTYS